MENKKHEPLFHIAKREQLPWHKAWGIRLLAIVAALIVCAVLTTILTGDNPIQVYGSIFNGSVRFFKKDMDNASEYRCPAHHNSCAHAWHSR